MIQLIFKVADTEYGMPVPEDMRSFIAERLARDFSALTLGSLRDMAVSVVETTRLALEAQRHPAKLRALTAKNTAKKRRRGRAR